MVMKKILSAIRKKIVYSGLSSLKIQLGTLAVLASGYVWFKTRNKSTMKKVNGGSGVTVAEQAKKEMKEWKGRTEDSEFGRSKIAEYWKDGVGVEPSPDPVKVPWSGAFISYTVQKGAPNSLPKAGNHSLYAKYSINAKGPFKYSSYPAHIIKEPKVGDIIIKARPGEERTFSELHGDEPFSSHGDIITEVYPDSVVAIGGNKTGNTVTSEKYPRIADGTIKGIFTVLRRGESPVYYATVPGMRRAKQSEVTPQMMEDAKTAVKVFALGELMYGDGYTIAVETHEDPARGKHRGASVFVPGENVA
jgi:hypothetical protein